MRRFYAPPGNFSSPTVILELEETRHLRDALRLRKDDEVRVFDGAGREFICRINDIGRKETKLQITGEISPAAPESPLELTLAIALLKGEKFDFAVQKACELGVSRVVPLITKRADVKIKDKQEAEKKLERWRRIILEAAKQCGRARLMNMENPVNFEDYVGKLKDTALLFSERGGVSFKNFAEKNAEISAVTVIIGSEGGWDDSELETAQNLNIQVITLGGRILRAETAAIAIPALLQNHFGDFY